MSPSGGDRDAAGAARAIAEAVARRSYGKLVALLAMRTSVPPQAADVRHVDLVVRSPACIGSNRECWSKG